MPRQTSEKVEKQIPPRPEGLVVMTKLNQDAPRHRKLRIGVRLKVRPFATLWYSRCAGSAYPLTRFIGLPASLHYEDPNLGSHRHFPGDP
jgi:hypothetical protein